MGIQDGSSSRAEIAAIIARESAQTLVGSAGGRRVTTVRRLLTPAAHVLARRFVEYDSRARRAGAAPGR